MGVRVVEVQAEFSAKAQKLDIIEPIAGKVASRLRARAANRPHTGSTTAPNDDFIDPRRTRRSAGVEVQLITRADDGNLGRARVPGQA